MGFYQFKSRPGKFLLAQQKYKPLMVQKLKSPLQVVESQSSLLLEVQTRGLNSEPQHVELRDLWTFFRHGMMTKGNKKMARSKCPPMCLPMATKKIKSLSNLVET